MSLTFSGASDKIFEKVNRHGILGRKIRSHLHGHEEIDLTFRLELGCKLSGSNVASLIWEGSLKRVLGSNHSEAFLVYLVSK